MELELLNIKHINITPEMLSIISDIDEFKGAWKTLDPKNFSELKTLKRINTIGSVASSNRIEGNKLSNSEVEELLLKIDKKLFRNRDEEEVIGYAELMDTVFNEYEMIPLTENYIKFFHSKLLNYSSKDERHSGEYKKLSNSVAAYDAYGKEIGLVLETYTPFETPILMEKLVNWTRINLEDRFYHPLVVIGIFIVVFLAIHPFQDGNGRLSRILTNFLMLKSGYTYMQYSSMESIVEENKNSYYRTLRQTQTTLRTNPDFNPWLIFFLKTLQKQKQYLENKVNKIIKNDYNQDLKLSSLSLRILELFNERSDINIAYMNEKLRISINTIRKAVKSLVNKEYLIKHGTTRGSWYTLKN